MKKLMILLVPFLLLTGCKESEIEADIESQPVQIANPASVYCEENGGVLDIREEEAGQYGVCVFSDGSECEEWAFYRGECMPSEMIPKPVETDNENMTLEDVKEMVRNYIMGMSEYIRDNGYHLEEIDTQILRCPGCYIIEYEYRIRESDSADVAGVADVEVTVIDWEVNEVKYWNDIGTEGEVIFPEEIDDLTEMTPDECIAKGGRTVNIVGGFTCDPDEETIGKVVGFISPNICCLKKQGDDITKEIEEAFLNKYPDWMEYNMEIIVSEVDGDYASGGSRPKDGLAGGGYFFAAETDDGWVIAADGNGNILCSDIEPYDFPPDMIPECWNDVNMALVER